MKRNENKIMGANNRFLIGLIVALSFTLVAFEWTSTRTYEGFTYDPKPMGEKDPEVLLPIFPRKDLERPKPKVEGPDMKIVEDIFKKDLPKEELKKEEHIDLTFDPDIYGGEEILPEENHPYVDFKKMEIYPHTNACIGLEGEAMKSCSQEEIIRLVKTRIKIPEILFDIGGKQGVQVEFTVNKNGEIEDVNVLQQTNKQLAVAATKTIMELPRLNPAVQNGMPVPMRITLPIVIDIRE